ncbi:SwmB domain-containing protein [Verminephrobacter aporrectodeae]|uniref:SwmB domain-containing protein n=1 Tax=Verminephrobacter aporrectodeae TaxID=1110389 RepID=UPI002238B79C|nr:SwmB domain-containing protein [Verminephrobacter aporrectodeae]
MPTARSARSRPTPTARLDSDIHPHGQRQRHDQEHHQRHLTGLTDDAGNAGVSIATSANYTVDTRPDTTPPVIKTATVSDNQLVPHVHRSHRLAATHIPPTTALEVRVDNVLTAVTAITVNAQDKTVSLTLATALSPGTKR